MKKHILFSLILIVIVMTLSSCSNSMAARYEKAIGLLNKGDYDKALKIFEELGTYADSLQYISYTKALVAFRNGSNYEAWEMFTDLGDFKQSVQYARYIYAIQMSDSSAKSYDILTSLGDFLDSKNRAETLENSAEMLYPVGSTIYYGLYEQDNIFENGAEPILWRVLSYHDNEAVLMTESIIDGGYDYQDLDNFLHDVFFGLAFGEVDSSMIYDIGILSEDEVRGYIPATNDRIAYATEYALSRGVAIPAMSNYGSCWWWTNTIGRRGAKYVLHTGEIGDESWELEINTTAGRRLGIRPFIIVDMQSLIYNL